MAGRFSGDATMEEFQKHVENDIARCNKTGIDYVHCIYPGFSWANLQSKRPNSDENWAVFKSIPREGAQFYWKLLAGALNAGSEMIYVVMYDEIDEGPAISKEQSIKL